MQNHDTDGMCGDGLARSIIAAIAAVPGTADKYPAGRKAAAPTLMTISTMDGSVKSAFTNAKVAPEFRFSYYFRINADCAIPKRMAKYPVTAVIMVARVTMVDPIAT